MYAAAIQVHAWSATTATTVTTASTSATALPTGARKVLINVTTTQHILFGGSGVAAAVVANDQPLYAGSAYVIDIPAGVTHFRAIAATTNGVLYASDVS